MALPGNIRFFLVVIYCFFSLVCYSQDSNGYKMSELQRERNLRSIIIAGVGLGLVFFFLTYRRYISKQRINKELMKRNEIIMSQKKEIEKINRRLELKFLQSRLNPHFLFNSLNAIQYFVGTNDRKAALKYISSFAQFLRQHLQTAASLRHTVLKESGLLKQYLLLEKNRFTGKFDFSVNIPQEPELLELDIPSLLTLSFVEFALYNRVLNRNDSNGFISVEFSQEDNQLLIKIEDNGIGRKLTSYPATEQGFSGLTPDAELVQERLKLLNADAANKEIEVEEMDNVNEQAVITGNRTMIRIKAMTENYQ